MNYITGLAKIFLLLVVALPVVQVYADQAETDKRAAAEWNNALKVDRGFANPQDKSLYGAGVAPHEVPAGCVKNPLPTVVVPPFQQFLAYWTDTEYAGITIWREPCINNPKKSAVFLSARSVNNPFICSSSFDVVQGGIQYDSVKLVNSPGGSSFCDDLLVTSTFLLDQWSFDNQFNEDAAFTLYHDGVSETTSVNIPAYSQPQPEPEPEDIIKLSLEEPTNNQPYTGIGNVRGWAIAPSGINRIALYIDGQYASDPPYGGLRTDVGEAFPDVKDSDNSGFAMAFGYTNLSVGKHTITARAYSKSGKIKEASSTFVVNKFHKDFIGAEDTVNPSKAQLSSDESSVLIKNINIDGQLYDVRLEWKTATQGFEIISID